MPVLCAAIVIVGIRGYFRSEVSLGGELHFTVAENPSVSPESASPDYRAPAICSLIRTGKTANALRYLEAESDLNVLRSALREIGLRGETAAADFVCGQCESKDVETAEIAFSVLPKVEGFRADVYLRGMARGEGRVNVAAIEAAAGAIAVSPELLPVVSEKINSGDDSISRAAIYVCLQFTEAAARDLSEEGMNARALRLAERNPQYAPAIAAALLRRRIQPDAALSAKLLSLDAGVVLKIAGEFRAFPDQADSDLLRQIALGVSDEAACAALDLLCSKNSRKNNRTLATIAEAIESGIAGRVLAVVKSFQADSEFLRTQLGIEIESISAANPYNDPYGGPGSINTSIVSGVFSDANAAATLTPTPHGALGLDVIYRFFRALSSVANNSNFPQGVRNQAQFLLLLHSRSPRMLEVVQQLLAGENDEVRRDVARLSLLRYDDVRYVKATLDSLATRSSYNIDRIPVFSALIAPYSAFGDDAHERVFLQCAKNLVACPDDARRVLGLALLAQYGKSNHAEYALALSRSESSAVRSAAAHCLARIAPEVYFFRMDAFLADANAVVRETVPAASLESGCERIFRISETSGFSQWASPRSLLPGYVPKGKIVAALKTLTNDRARSVRLAASLALIEQGGLPDSSTLLRDADPALTARLSSRIAKSINIARAAGRELPADLAGIGRVAGLDVKKGGEGEARIVIFLKRDARNFPVTDCAITAFDIIIPKCRVDVHYLTDDITRLKLDALCSVFPVSYADEGKKIIAFSSGGWVAGDTLSFSDLSELLSHADNFDSELLDRILPPDAAPAPVVKFRFGLRQIVLGGALLFVLACVLTGVVFIIRKKRRENLFVA